MPGGLRWVGRSFPVPRFPRWGKSDSPRIALGARQLLAAGAFNALRLLKIFIGERRIRGQTVGRAAAGRKVFCTRKREKLLQFRTAAEPRQRWRAGRFVPAVGDGEAAENRLGLELLAGTPSVCAPAQHFFVPYATSAGDFVTPDVDPRRGAGFLQEKHRGRRGREGAVPGCALGRQLWMTELFWL